ncbi:MAG TPA: AGE family epimerase/isomerase [Saprospiraceae bacterium]|nr:AGE family epimerase/isomerase [Saprospiraceae bacterium]
MKTDEKISGQVQLFREEISSELIHILNWWRDNMTDHRHGGFYGRMDGNGVLHPESDKGAVLNARILWAFSAGAKIPKDTSYEEMAHRAYDYFITHFIDKVYGGVYWMIDFMGKPVENKKQVYAQAFAVYALSEYYLLSGKQEAIDGAFEIFNLIEKHSLDIEYGGYTEALNREWGTLDDVRLSDKDQQATKTMNTHLHLLEAYTQLYKVTQAKEVREALQHLIRLFIDRFVDIKSGHLHLFFDQQWNLLSDIDSYGHDIEASWLLVEAAEALEDEALIEETKRVSVLLADAVLRDGVAPDGSLYNERHGDHPDKDRHWWQQAEAVVGFWNAFQITNNQTFLDASLRTWDYIKQFVVDNSTSLTPLTPLTQEWHWRIDDIGNPILSEDKAGPWKCPYHNSRMCIEIIIRLNFL